jgi:hypothetical protein
MLRKVFEGALLLIFVFACNNEDKKKPGDVATPVTGLRPFFPKAKLPYQLADTTVLNTGILKEEVYDFSKFIADSVRNKFFGKNITLRFTPHGYLANSANENFYIVQASTPRKKAAFLLVYDAEGTFAASTPFLLPDDNPYTTQVTSIDKSFTITKTTIKREGSDITGEGKEVISYNSSAKSFDLVMLDALDNNTGVLQNPIDTFPKKNKHTGDYYINKKNLVSIRDGRFDNQLLVFIHTENEAGDCTGQMKGEFVISSSTTAAYQQGGDPCRINLSFNANTVTISEASGCGNYRDLDCPLSGTFNRKKEIVTKQLPKKQKRK